MTSFLCKRGMQIGRCETEHHHRAIEEIIGKFWISKGWRSSRYIVVDRHDILTRLWCWLARLGFAPAEGTYNEQLSGNRGTWSGIEFRYQPEPDQRRREKSTSTLTNRTTTLRSTRSLCETRKSVDVIWVFLQELNVSNKMLCRLKALNRTIETLDRFSQLQMATISPYYLDGRATSRHGNDHGQTGVSDTMTHRLFCFPSAAGQ